METYWNFAYAHPVCGTVMFCFGMLFLIIAALAFLVASTR